MKVDPSAACTKIENIVNMSKDSIAHDDLCHDIECDLGIELREYEPEAYSTTATAHVALELFACFLSKGIFENY